jgi:hypothetical protein
MEKRLIRASSCRGGYVSLSGGIVAILGVAYNDPVTQVLTNRSEPYRCARLGHTKHRACATEHRTRETSFGPGLCRVQRDSREGNIADLQDQAGMFWILARFSHRCRDGNDHARVVDGKEGTCDPTHGHFEEVDSRLPHISPPGLLRNTHVALERGFPGGAVDGLQQGAVYGLSQLATRGENNGALPELP